MYIVVSLHRILFVFLEPPKTDETIFNLSMAQGALLLAYQMLYFVLTFGLIMMVTRRLQLDVEAKEKQEDWAKKELVKSEEMLKEAQKVAHIGHWVWNMNGSGYWSDEMCRIFGAEDNGFVLDSDSFERAIHPDDIDFFMSKRKSIIETGESLEIENRIIRNDGEVRYVISRATSIREPSGAIVRIIGTVQDITERKLAELEIKKSLAEKEILLRELYHRTKNNMSVIDALLELQTDQFEDDNIKEIFYDTRNRIQSMALVHQKLYETRDLSSINLREYISELAGLLVSGCSHRSGYIELRYNMQDVAILIDAAIPCGLVLNELITNALKYAFLDGPGVIEIELFRADEETVEFKVSDNGKGVPFGFDPRRDAHLGMKNIFALVEYQLKGSVQFKFDGGVSCRVRFKDDQYRRRV
jgi:PAS domain S-box-containing protein